jgi:CO dehydrogenase nickel-insertion accessory protein CooC1
LKLAITGKGGVGITTLAGTLARLCAAEGRSVLATDADPDANFASALSYPEAIGAKARPILVMKEPSAERTGLRPGGAGAVDALIGVGKPGTRGVKTARAMKRLDTDLGIPQVLVVESKVHGLEDRDSVASNLPDMRSLGFLEPDPPVVEANREGLSTGEKTSSLGKTTSGLLRRLEQTIAPESSAG